MASDRHPLPSRGAYYEQTQPRYAAVQQTGEEHFKRRQRAQNRWVDPRQSSESLYTRPRSSTSSSLQQTTRDAAPSTYATSAFAPAAFAGPAAIDQSRAMGQHAHMDITPRMRAYSQLPPSDSPPRSQTLNMVTYHHQSPLLGYPSQYSDWSSPPQPQRSSQDVRARPVSREYYTTEPQYRDGSISSVQYKNHPQRRPSNRDEFDGPAQLLDKPDDLVIEPTEDDLPQLPITLYAQEQDDILSRTNDRLSQCAFDFVAKYQFPIPIEPDKRPVRVPADREWSEWVYLLKRLATKRRIPSRVLYNGQIKQFITILENSLEMRHAAKHQSRPLKDDRNVLQLISSGIQVAKIVKDAPAMKYLNELYSHTERTIRARKQPSPPGLGFAAA